MPALRNQRHEAFARAVAEGKSLAAAFVAAGYRPHPANPTRLRDRREIDERIGEITAERSWVVGRALERAIERTAIDSQRRVLTVDLARLRDRVAEARERLAAANVDNHNLYQTLEPVVGSHCPGLAAAPYRVHRYGAPVAPE